MEYLLIIPVSIILIIIFNLINNKMTKKKVQKKYDGTVRVYRSERSYDYVDYPTMWHYENSNDYSSDSVHDVSSFEGFGGGDFGGGGASGSYSDSSSSDSSSSD